MKKILIALIISSISYHAKSDFNTALIAYNTKDYKHAYEEFQELAKLGDKQSQFNIGVMYYQGQFVKKDRNKAYAWLKIANQGEQLGKKESDILKIVQKGVSIEQAEISFSKINQQYGAKALLKNLYPNVKPENKSENVAIPIDIVSPRYPRKMAMKGIEGYTTFEFDLDKKGRPRNVLLIDSFPIGGFEKDSIKAIKKWRFEPVKDNKGNPVVTKNVRYTMRYQLKRSGTDIENKRTALVSFDNPDLVFSRYVKPKHPRRLDKKETKHVISINFNVDNQGNLSNLKFIGDEHSRYQKEIKKVFTKWKLAPIKNNTNVAATVTFERTIVLNILPKKGILNGIQEKAKQGDLDSQMLYGLLLEKFPLLEGAGNQNEWYLKAATRGHMMAQYLLGKNLISGKGCEISQSKGIEWLARAASNGQVDALKDLGLIYATRDSLENQKLAKKYLLKATQEKNTDRAKFRLASILVNSPYEKIRDPKKALELVNKINWEKTGDRISKFELLAAANAQLGNFEKAIKLQQKALKQARKGEYDDSDITVKLAMFIERKALF